MKVAVFSDTHGSLARLPMVLAALPALDAVLHLGDFAGDAAIMKEQHGEKTPKCGNFFVAPVFMPAIA